MARTDFAMWFCAAFVKEDLPDPATLDTMWKVGAWTWTWMEPAIGTASFVLLALQLVRSHMQKIDLKPYRGLVSSWRADRLHRSFPRYEREIVRDYAKSDLWARDTNRARKGAQCQYFAPPLVYLERTTASAFLNLTAIYRLLFVVEMCRSLFIVEGNPANSMIPSFH